jgi:hypothetical protein
MANKEATTHIRVNKLLETAGWHFFADPRKTSLLSKVEEDQVEKVGALWIAENF